MHMEHTCSYTVVTVPKEGIRRRHVSKSKYVLFLKLNGISSTGITMSSNLAVVFSRKLLTHHQHCINITMFFSIIWNLREQCMAYSCEDIFQAQ